MPLNVHFFVGMLIFGALIGGSLGGFNWKNVKGDKTRDSVVVRNRIVLGMIVGVILCGLIGFFVR